MSLLENLPFDAKGKNNTQIKAWEYLNEIGLPGKKSESYKFSPITAILSKNIDWSIGGLNNISSDHFYQIQGNHLVFLNGAYLSEKSQITDITVSVKDVSEGKHDPFSLLNTSFAKEEIVLHTTNNSSQVFIYHFQSEAFSNPRIKVLVDKNQEVAIIQKFIPTTEFKTFNNAYIDFEIAENGIGFHTKIQNYHSSAFSHESTFAHVERDGKFYDNTFSFNAAFIRNNLTINLKGENCEGHMNGIFLLDGKSHVDNNTSVDHQMPNSYSNELYKGILDERSTGVFNGKIYVRKDAQKTNAFQSNNNVLLSNDAVLHTKPQLEIWADDVKCSHGCTSGQLDEDALFYLRARGIDQKSAKALLLNAFASEALKNVKQEALRVVIEELVRSKLS